MWNENAPPEYATPPVLKEKTTRLIYLIFGVEDPGESISVLAAFSDKGIADKLAEAANRYIKDSPESKCGDPFNTEEFSEYLKKNKEWTQAHPLFKYLGLNPDEDNFVCGFLSNKYVVSSMPVYSKEL